MNKGERRAAIEDRKHVLHTYSAEDHIAEAERLIERGERQPFAPAAATDYAAATAHATLAVAKMAAGRNDA